MSSSSKRKLTEPSNSTQPLRKRRKTNDTTDTNTATISSAKFSNKSDQIQFQSIFDCVEKSPLIQQLKICKEITKSISEFATGNIKLCAKNKCENEIFLLQSTLEEYNPNHSNSYLLHFKHCQISDKFYCYNCMNDADCNYHHDSDCNRKNMLYFNTDRCYGCHAIFNNELQCCDVDMIQVYERCGGPGCNNLKLCQDCSLHPEMFNDRFHREYAPCIGCGDNFCLDCCVHNHMASCVCNTCFDKDSEECTGKCGKKLNDCEYNMYENWGGLPRQPRDCCDWREKCYTCNSCYGLTCNDCKRSDCSLCGMIYCISCVEYKENFICDECSDEESDKENV